RSTIPCPPPLLPLHQDAPHTCLRAVPPSPVPPLPRPLRSPSLPRFGTCALVRLASSTTERRTNKARALPILVDIVPDVAAPRSCKDSSARRKSWDRRRYLRLP